MNRTEKATVVEKLARRFSRSSSIYLTDFTGLTVTSITTLRRRLRDAGVDYVVVKNTLATRALTEASISGLEVELNGPTGFVLTEGDPASAAKIIKDFQKVHKRPTVTAGMVDGLSVTPQEIDRLASLPGHEQLMGQMVGVLQAPLQAFLGVTNGLLNQFVGVLEALRSQRS